MKEIKMMRKIGPVMITVLLATMLPLTTLGSQVQMGMPEKAVGKAEQEVIFPDSNLEEAIREAIDKPEGPIYTTDLEGLTELEPGGRDITDLTGLEYCINMEHLWFPVNQISDLSPLSDLASLKKLNLFHNQISDLSPLSELTNLEVLHLGLNQISDLTPLSDLTDLECLELSHNQISDIKPLVDSPGLSEGDNVNLKDNPLSTTSIEVYIPQLEERGAKISWTLPEPEQRVTFLDPNLEAAIRWEIGKPGGSIYTTDLKGLTKLDATGVNITNLAGLEHCINLRGLNLDFNEISDLSPLSNLTNLAELHLGLNQISDISALSKLSGLEWLDLYENKISDLSPLSTLTNLTWLSLKRNKIGDVSPLSELTKLRGLKLGLNQISDISPLTNLTNLTRLILDRNKISDISPLSNLTNLKNLYLNCNQISGIKPLVDNAGLSEGDNVNLKDNPLSTTSIKVYIPQLEERGAQVRY